MRDSVLLCNPIWPPCNTAFVNTVQPRADKKNDLEIRQARCRRKRELRIHPLIQIRCVLSEARGTPYCFTALRIRPRDVANTGAMCHIYTTSIYGRTCIPVCRPEYRINSPLRRRLCKTAEYDRSLAASEAQPSLWNATMNDLHPVPSTAKVLVPGFGE
jgi:hypothetical protein